MVGETRARMIDGTVRLLATRGLAGASFGELVASAGVPRGSLYHHFPDGKDELVAAALAERIAATRSRLRALRGASPERLVDEVVDDWRRLLVATGFRAGCSVAAVAVAADDELLDAAGDAFVGWHTELARLLRSGGVDAGAADEFAVLLLAATEGAVVLCRARRDAGPLDSVAASLRDAAGRLPRA